MKNRTKKSSSKILVTAILSAMLLSGCGMETEPQEGEAIVLGRESTVTEEDGIQEENASPSETVRAQVIKEWKEMYDAFYDYQDCSAVLSERREQNGTIEEIFMVDITYTIGQSEGEEPEHFIADMKASYPADRPDEITVWMDNSGGAMTDLMLFKECGPG